MFRLNKTKGALISSNLLLVVNLEERWIPIPTNVKTYRNKKERGDYGDFS